MTPVLLPVAAPSEVRARLRSLLRGRARLTSLTLAVMILDSVFGLAGPVAIGWIAQIVSEHGPLTRLWAPVLLLGAAAVGAAVAGWASAVLLARLILPAVARLREDVVAAASELPIDAVETGGTGDLVSRVSGDAELVTDAATGAVGSFVGAALAILSTLAGLAALDWRFAVAGLAAVPLQIHTLRWYLRASGPVYAAGRAADGRRAAALLTGFTMLPTLRTLRLGRRQHRRITEASLESMDCEFEATRTATRFYGRLNLAEFTGLGAILLTAFLLVHAGLATVGAATTAALFFAALFDPLNTVLGVFDDIQRAGAGLARLVGIGGKEPGGPLPAEPTAPRKNVAGTQSATRTTLLAAEGLSAGYSGGPDVLHDVGLRLEQGRKLAIVGASGSGKSTLASVLTGLRPARAGAVTFHGTDVADLELPQRRLALLSQESHLFTGTITENLLLARPGATESDVLRAVEAVGAQTWIAALPQGLGTTVGGGGRPLPPAHGQQLALARVLLLDPEVVILDEATAEAGSDAARLLDHAARRVLDGRSSITIAHRLSQAREADRILVMEGGRVVEEGTHRQLLDLGGAYARLWKGWDPDGPGAEAQCP
ncbi:ABC transporter ATP-binding protein [Arthrobacter sp. NPDC090010]|uniref:ABC transporter ATP-binding protein n=1 Tax=Arthrobacter sp. NPDC090010 TaxID=3363942 RepID=UPI00381BC335